MSRSYILLCFSVQAVFQGNGERGRSRLDCPMVNGFVVETKGAIKVRLFSMCNQCLFVVPKPLGTLHKVLQLENPIIQVYRLRYTSPGTDHLAQIFPHT